MPCGAFLLRGAFSFCAGVRIYAAIRSEALKRFWAALRWCFRCGVALCLSVLFVTSSVMAQILPVWAFYGVGSVFVYH